MNKFLISAGIAHLVMTLLFSFATASLYGIGGAIVFFVVVGFALPGFILFLLEMLYFD